MLKALMNRMQNSNSQNNTRDSEEHIGNNGIDSIKFMAEQELAKDLKKLQVPTFNGKQGEKATEDWLEKMETYFSVKNISSEAQTAWATINFSGPSLQWWKSYKAQQKIQGVNLKWEDFVIAFKK